MLVGMTAAASPTRPPHEGRDGRSAIRIDQVSPNIRVTTEGTTVVISVEGELDVTAGEALVDAAKAAVATSNPARLDIDLRALESFDEKGAVALVECRVLGAQLAEGLHYRTGRGPGREALLAAYTEIELGNDASDGYDRSIESG
jgi:hypothetical protein